MVNRFLKFLSGILFATVLAGCDIPALTDPFEGHAGVRVNVNGNKCITWERPSFMTSEYIKDETYQYSFTIGLIRVKDNLKFNLKLKITDPAPLVTGKRYIIDGEASKASLTRFQIDMPDVVTPLQGWLEFTNLSEEGSIAEALFELENPGDATLKHGFLRLSLKTVTGE